jgi:hypothetical protein
MGWRVARIEEIRTKFWSEKLKARYHSEERGVGGRIITEFIVGGRVGGNELDSSGSG